MKWSWRLARVAGIDIYVHVTFVALLALLAWMHHRAGGGGAAVLAGVGFVVAVFAVIVLHELGHALAARRYGIRTRDITLYPIGGVARLERIPENPGQELVVALAGPAVNVVIAAALFAGLLIGAGPQALLDSLERLRAVPAETGEFTMSAMDFLANLMVVNVGLVIFNMIPAFPMDGGRVLRAILAMTTDYVRATRIAAAVGQAAAAGFGVLGLVIGHPMLLVIAFFVWMGAAQEAASVQLKAALGGIPVRHAMITDFRTLSPSEPVGAAVELLLAGFQQDFPVVSQGRVAGVLTRSDLVKALASGRTTATVGDAMQSQFETAEALEPLDSAFTRLQGCESCRSAPVLQGGELVGLLTAENVGEFLLVQSALRQGASTRTTPASPPTPVPAMREHPV